MAQVRASRKVTYAVSCTVEDQQETLYVCPANCRSEMSLLFLSNNDSSTDVSVMWDRADGTHAHILGGKNLHLGEYLQFSDGIVVFEAGDAMHVTVSGNSSPHMDVLCTVEEIFLPNS